MENATKALIIAAAVLIAILLISLGVGVFNTASEQMSGADLTEYEIQKFNDKFAQYEGTDVTAAKVNSMLKVVFNHNQSQDNETTRVRVGLDGETNWLIRREGFNPRESYPKVSVGNRYTVKAKYDSKTGLIYQIDVTTKN